MKTSTIIKSEEIHKSIFYKGLIEGNISLIRQVPKSDLHAHSTRNGRISHFEKKYNTKITQQPTFETIDEMERWYAKNIKSLFSNKKESFEERLKSAFIAAEEDNVKKLMLSFGAGSMNVFDGSIDKYIEKIEKIKNDNYSGEFIPELCLTREWENNNYYKEIIDREYFKSVDLVGDEKLGVDGFIEVFKYAKGKGMTLRCHIGEFESSEYVDDAVDKLNLDEIQHGLSIVQSKDLIKKVKKNGIQVNLCPASNVGLKRVKEYSYPLRILLDNEIKVTVNTDDLLIFNRSISEIYIDLYQTGLFSKEELDQIRNNGLKYKVYSKNK